VLGARQTGVNSWEVQPAFESVEQASGKLPLPQGDLDISWEVHSTADLTVNIDAPPDSFGKLILPFISGASVSINGKQVWSDNSPVSSDIQLSNEHLFISLQDGSSSITLLNNSTN
jgi:hypothetical protein